MNGTRRLTRIALMSALMVTIFFAFSSILYVEAITLTVITVAMAFDKQDSFLATAIFGLILVIYLGLSPWAIMYLFIYPTYSLLTSLLRNTFDKHDWMLIVFGFILSCATGLILDLPFILLNSKVTIYYIISGLKTSLIQGSITAIEFALLYPTFVKVLRKIKEQWK